MLHNPLLKALASVVVGGVLATVDSAVQSPTGGTAAWIAAAPSHGVLWTFGALLVHNLISGTQYAPKQ